MSFILMAKAMKIKTGSAARKLVLLKLADNANDDGYCFPSYQYIADQCELSRKTVIGHVAALEKMGLLVKQTRRVSETENTSNSYLLTLDNASEETTPPSVIATPPSNTATLPPSVITTPKPITLSKPINEPIKNNKKKALDYSCWPNQPDNQILQDWLTLRKNLKAPVTQTAINRLSAEFLKAAQAGYSVDDCLGLCCERGWRGFKYEWLINSNQNTGARNAKNPDREAVSRAIENWQDISWAQDLIDGTADPNCPF